MRGVRCVVLAALLVSACGGSGPDDDVATTGRGDGLSGEVLVSAAASLTDAFADIAATFEDTYPGVDVVLNLGGSPTLREQILEGAPADVFASADRSNMDPLVDARATEGAPQVFAHNVLQIAVPAGNAAGVTGLQDLADPSLFIGLCAAGVPCGSSARGALAKAGVSPSIDTNEPDVRALLTKIEAGELDAGITYRTDVAAAGARVDGIAIPERSNVVAEYPIAVLADAPNPEAARAFVRMVLSRTGRTILREHGFSAP